MSVSLRTDVQRGRGTSNASRPHFDPTQELPEDGWNSFQGVPHQYPTEGEPLQLSMEYGTEQPVGPLKEGYAYPEYQPGLLESLPDPDAPFRAREEDRMRIAFGVSSGDWSSRKGWVKQELS